MTEYHEVAEVLDDLIQKDGAGSWPPNANHRSLSWPVPLRPYQEIQVELASLLPQENPSLDDQLNTVRIAEYRQQFQSLLREGVNIAKLKKVRDAATTTVCDERS